MADDLGSVKSFEASCVVPDDPGEVVRGARPATKDDVEIMAAQRRERQIAAMRYDPVAVAERERRIAIAERHALPFKRKRA